MERSNSLFTHLIKHGTHRYRTNRYKTIKAFVLVPFVFASLLVGCLDEDSPDSDAGSTSRASLSGTLYLTDSFDSNNFGDIYALDPQTRVARRLIRPFPDRTIYSTSVRYLRPQVLSPNSFLYGVNACVEQGIVDHNFCLERVNIDGNIERLFRINDRELDGSPAMSPDGELVALVETVPSGVIGPLYLSLYTKDGELLQQLTLASNPRYADISNLVWTADNRLIYGLRRDDELTIIAISEPGSLTWNLTETKVLSTEANYMVPSVSLSSSERLLAYDTNQNPRQTFILELDTGTTSRLDSSAAVDVYRPVWSPDEKYLLVNHNEAGGDTGDSTVLFGLEDSPYQMLVEWTGEPVEINVFNDDRNVDEGGQLFNYDPGADFDVLGRDGRFRDEWQFDNFKQWVAD